MTLGSPTPTNKTELRVYHGSVWYAHVDAVTRFRNDCEEVWNPRVRSLQYLYLLEQRINSKRREQCGGSFEDTKRSWNLVVFMVTCVRRGCSYFAVRIVLSYDSMSMLLRRESFTNFRWSVARHSRDFLKLWKSIHCVARFLFLRALVVAFAAKVKNTSWSFPNVSKWNPDASIVVSDFSRTVDLLKSGLVRMLIQILYNFFVIYSVQLFGTNYIEDGFEFGSPSFQKVNFLSRFCSISR